MSSVREQTGHGFQRVRSSVRHYRGDGPEGRHLWAVAIPVAFTLVLGGAFIGRASLWTDEITTWSSSTQPIPRIIANSSHIDATFLPYYLFMHFWLAVSWSASWMRLPSLLSGAAAVAALVLLAQRWLPPLWSMLAGLLLVLNPLFALWTIEARPYAIAMLFAVLSTASLVAAIERGGTRSWVRYGLASLCMLLSHLIAALVLVAQLVGVAVARRRSVWRYMTATLACVVVAASPLAVLAAGETGQISWIPPSGPGTFQAALFDISGGGVQEIVVVISTIIMVICIFASPPGGDEALRYALCLAWATVPPLLLVALSFLHPIFLARYTVVSVPGIALIEAMAGYTAWTVFAMRYRAIEQVGPETHAPPVRSGTRAPPGPIILALIICSIVCASNFNTSRQELEQSYYTDNYRSASAALSHDLSERPAPVLITPNWAAAGFSYYATPLTLAHALADPSNQAGLPPGSSLLYWPIGVKPVTHGGRCVVGWAIGRGVVPSTAFNVDGSRCRLAGVQHYGEVWIASVTG
jgi:uncharacterized membrane protein